MIISHKYKFIFIHITKCAGSSMTHAIAPHLGEDDLVIGVTPEGERISEELRIKNGLHKHCKAKEAKEILGNDIWDNYFKFSFVRNPWDLLVSTYHWWLVTPWDDQWQTGKKIKELKNFEEYLFSPYRRQEGCSEFLFDDEGNCLVDFIGRQERINKDFAYACGRTGLPNLKLPRRNTTKHNDFHQYYNEKTKNLVKKWLAQDVTNFQYFFQHGL